MLRLPCCATSVVSLLLLAAMTGVARPASAGGQSTPSNDQTRTANRFAERDRLWNEALSQLNLGKRQTAAAAAEKVVAIERRLLGNDHAEVANTLIWLARTYTEVDNFLTARKSLEEALAIRNKAYGAKDWRTVDARWELKHLESVQKLATKDRQELYRGAQLHREMWLDIERGDYARAVIKAGELLPLRQKLLSAPDLDLLRDLVSATLLMDALGEPNSAWGFGQQALKMCEGLYPASLCPGSHPQLRDCSSTLARIAFDQGAYAVSLEFYEKAFSSGELLFPAEQYPAGDPTLAESLDGVALTRWRTGDLVGATKAYERAFAMRKQLYPMDQFPLGHAALAMNLNSLGQISHAREEFEAARRYFDEALGMLERVYPKNDFPDGHLDLAAVHNNLAALLDDQGHSAEARRHYEISLAVFERVYSKDEYPAGHRDLAAAISNMGQVLTALDDYVAARKHFERALAMEEQLYPVDSHPQGHPDIAKTLNSLGTLLSMQGDFDGALQYQERSVAMNRRLYPATEYPQGHMSLAISIDNLANTQQGRGDYAAARELFEESLRMRELLFPREDYPDGNTSLALAHNNLADLLKVQGDYQAALDHYLASVSMLEKLFSVEQYPNGHPYLAASLNNLAGLLREVHQPEASRKLYERALAMKERLFPAELFPHGHSDLVTAYSELGTLLFEMQDYAAAQEQFSRAVAMCEKLYPEDSYAQGHPQLSTALNNLAYALRAQGKLPEARTQFERSVAILEQLYPQQAFSEGHPALATALDNLGTLLAMEGKLDEALALVSRASAMELASLRNVFGGASEQTMRAYLLQQEGTSDTLITLAVLKEDDARRRDVFRAVIERKTALHDALLELRQLERAGSTHPDVKEMVQNLREKRLRMVDLALLPITRDSSEERDRLAAEASSLEASLNRQVKEILGADRTSAGSDVEVTRLGERIDKNGALIEIVRYSPYELSSPKADSPWQPDRYAAFVLRGGKDGKLTLIDLGAADTIDTLVHELRQTVADVPRELRTTDEADLEEQYRELAQKLSQAIWLPLKDAIAGATHLFIGSDGELTRIPFEALVDDEGRYLLESFAITYVSSAGDLLRQADQRAEGTVVFAAPNYELQAVPARPQPEALASHDAGGEAFRGDVSADVRGLNWLPLPGTRKEADRIRSLLDGQDGFAPVAVLSDDKALEGELKALPAPRILHLATHGFYLPDQQANGGGEPAATAPAVADKPATTSERLATLRAVENPLLRSGIILAGANRPQEQNSSDTRVDDGWATAEEIGMLDLTGTELVVLSACETGLGDVRTGEGVSGLRRAFLHAGARTLVTSLYKVPDDATQELMGRFYERLASGATKQAALRDAQLATIAARRKEFGAAHPFFWASFVLVGSPD